MARNTSIEWCDHTFNPWIGCAKVSAGCTHCYAETLMDKRMGKAKWGPHGTRVRTSAAYWRQPLRWNKESAAIGARPLVFCASLADVFEDRPELVQWRKDLFALIDATPHLNWLLLTKRPENIIRFWPGTAGADDMSGTGTLSHAKLDNVWLGTSVEDQAAANERIPHLLAAAHLCRFTFLSCEPLLGPVHLTNIPTPDSIYVKGMNALTGFGRKYFTTTGGLGAPSINWVIAGGESGPKARPMYLSWARSLRDQCAEAGVPFFFKQWGEHAPHPYVEGGVLQSTGNTDLVMQTTVRIGKKKAGRLLDGQEHNAFPE